MFLTLCSLSISPSHLLHFLQSELQLYNLLPQAVTITLLGTGRQLILETLDDCAKICFAQLEGTHAHTKVLQPGVVHKW